MKRLTLAAGIGSLLLLQVFSLQAQNPANLPVDEPVFRADSRTYQDPIAQPVPDPLTSQPAQGQKAQDEESNEFAKYPIWLLIKPDGVQFLQTQEEIANNRNTIPPHAFLVCCVTANFKAAAGEQQPEFQLICEDFLLRGRYGSKQYLEVTGASLNFSTQTQQVQLRGSEGLQLEFHSLDAVSETRMQADEILLQLNASPVNETRYVTMSVVDSKTGRESVITKPIVEQIARGTSFQLSAKNITSLETIASPANTAGTDAPMWNPNTPQPIPEDAPIYEDPGFKPVPSRKSRSDVFPGGR